MADRAGDSRRAAPDGGAEDGDDGDVGEDDGGRPGDGDVEADTRLRQLEVVKTLLEIVVAILGIVALVLEILKRLLG